MYQPKYFAYNSVNSTNDTAFELLAKNDCVVVTAEFQTKGRGRNNKTWYGSKGQNLYYTFGINHSIDEIPLHLFQMLGGMAVFNVLNEISSKSIFRLKYPNDVYGIDSAGLPKKVSGVISETNFTSAINCSSIIGIGINVNQTEFPKEIFENCTSIKLLNIEIQLAQLAEKLTSEILQMLDKSSVEIFNNWKSLINLDNKKINVVSNSAIKNSDTVSSDTVTYYLKIFLEDGRLVVISDAGVERIIDNGDSIRYDL